MNQRLKPQNSKTNEKGEAGIAKRILAREIVRTLREDLKGRVIAPGDADYDRARTPFYSGFDRRPMAIVRAADVEDVAYIISLRASLTAPPHRASGKRA